MEIGRVPGGRCEVWVIDFRTGGQAVGLESGPETVTPKVPNFSELGIKPVNLCNIKVAKFHYKQKNVGRSSDYSAV